MTVRREFLRQAGLIAAGTVVGGAVTPGELAATPLGARGVAPPDTGYALPSAATPLGRPPRAPGDWDMSWADRVTGSYRMCFDAHEISDGVCLHQVRSFLAGYADALGLADADVCAVLVARHAAVPLVLDDALWADGNFAEKDELVDPVTGEPARRNPFIRVPADAKHALTWPDGALDTLMSRGVIVLACDLALNNLAGGVARRKSISRDDARALISANLLPGVYRLPSGIFATSHAQSLGCGVLNAV